MKLKFHQLIFTFGTLTVKISLHKTSITLYFDSHKYRSVFLVQTVSCHDFQSLVFSVINKFKSLQKQPNEP